MQSSARSSRPPHNRPGRRAASGEPAARSWLIALTCALPLAATAAVPAAAVAAPSRAPASAAAQAPAGPPVTMVAPGSVAASGGSGDGRSSLTRAQVSRQMAAARRLRAQLASQDTRLARARAALERASAASAAAMDRVARARAAQARALRAEQAARAELRRLTFEAAQARDDVDSMAVDAYINGTGSMQDVAALVQVATGDPDALASAPLASYLAGARSADEATFTSLATRQQQVAARASRARAERQRATAQAIAAQRQANQLVARQRATLARIQAQLASSRARLRASQSAVRATTGGFSMAKAGRAVNAPLCSSDMRAYPNGRLPASALCPLATAPGHRLRPRAARAFDAMSRAYRDSTGSFLCVTDSYRSFAYQVSVRARLPHLAAVPGTSTHGLGLAVDLCGGVQSFGTRAHAWMRQNAPLFGFYLPSWARENGALPEPWHWEYGG